MPFYTINWPRVPHSFCKSVLHLSNAIVMERKFCLRASGFLAMRCRCCCFPVKSKATFYSLTGALHSNKMSLLPNTNGFENILAARLEVELFKLKTQHEQSYFVVENESDLHSLVKRSDFPVMHVKQSKKKRTCQNMNGILGGSNAFNFLSFVAGVITLVRVSLNLFFHE